MISHSNEINEQCCCSDRVDVTFCATQRRVSRDELLFNL